MRERYPFPPNADERCHGGGSRVHVLGVRVHEWQLGVALLVLGSLATVWGVVSPTSLPVVGLGAAAGWLVLKDWRDLFPARRDTGAWRVGFHRPPSPLRVLRRFDSLPSVAAGLAAATGIANLVWALSPGGSWLDDLLPHVAPLGSTPIFGSLALPAGLGLLACAFYLLRRRRTAWAFAVTLMLALAAVELVRGRHLREVGLSLAAAGCLWGARDAFCVRPCERAMVLCRRVGALLFGFVLLELAAVVAIVHTAGAATAKEAFALVTWQPAGPTPLFDEAAMLPSLIRAATLLVLLAAIYLAFRPPVPGEPSTEGERDRAVDLVRAHGSDTPAFFKLRRDTHRLFSTDGRAFLAYRIEAGVLLLSGDPIGPTSAIPDLLRQACAFAEEHGLRLAVLGAGGAFLRLYEQAGLHALYLGDEAIVDTQRFALEGRAIRKVRQSVHRLERAGYTVTLQPLGTMTRDDLLALGRVSLAWRRGKPERGFAMALDALDPADHAETLVATARDNDGLIRAFLHFVPTYGRAAVSLSAMRRELETPNGLTEFLVVRAIEALRARGVDEVSLNFAAFARMLYAPRNRREQLFGRLLSLFDRYFQIDRLYRFNAKFSPRWEPRHLLFEGRLGIARAALASLWVEGQLPRARLIRRPQQLTARTLTGP